MKNHWREILAFIGVIALALFVIISANPPKGDKTGVLMVLPEQLDNYIGREIEVSKAELEILPPDTELSKMQYYSTDSEFAKHAVQFTIVLSGESRTSIHKPEICMQGQGWNLIERKVIPVEIAGEKLEVMVVELEKDQPLEEGGFVSMKGVYMYWFIGDEASTPNNGERMWLTAKQNIFDNINPRWAYASVFIAVPIENQELAGQLELIMSKFVAKIVPKFQKQFIVNIDE